MTSPSAAAGRSRVSGGSGQAIRLTGEYTIRSSVPSRIFRAVLAIVWIVAAGAATASGLDYYLLPWEERAYSALHDTFAPTGVFGHRLGVVGAAMMAVGVAMYSARKRVGFLQRIGRLSYWLDVHIFLCTLGPFLVLLHTAFKIGGIVSIAFWSMVVVVTSGVFGRYLYGQIPKTINGRFLSLQQIQSRRDHILERLAAKGLTSEDVERLTPSVPEETPRGFIRPMFLAVRYDIARALVARRLRRHPSVGSLPSGTRTALTRTLRSELSLHRQMVLLTPFQRLFRYWHLFHLPLALLMLAIVVGHVAIAIMFGYGWPT